MTERNRALRGALWNMRYGRNPEKVGKTVRWMLKRYRLDFMLLQEAHDYIRELKRIPGFHLVYGDSQGADQSVILVSDRVKHGPGWVKNLSGDGWRTVDGKRHVGMKSATVLIDGWLRVWSIHGPVSVSWPKGRIAGPDERVDDYKTHSRRVRRLSRRAPHVLFGGDWNARTFERGKFTPFWISRFSGLEITEPNRRRGPGHDGIDYVLSRGVRVFRMRKRKTYGSDHPLITFKAKRP